MLNRRVFLGAACSLPFGGSVASSGDTSTIRFRTSGSLPRSRFLENQGWQGFEVELARDLTGRIPRLSLEFISNYNWARAMKSIVHGDVDLMTGVSFREERMEYLDYIGVTDLEEVYLITRVSADVPPLNSLEALTSFSRPIQVNFSAAWHPEFDQALKSDKSFRASFSNISGSAYKDHDELVEHTSRRIRLGRIDGAILAYYTALDIKLTSPDPDERGEPLKLTRVTLFGAPPTYLVASRRLDSGLRRDIRAAYLDMRRDLTFSRIWKKWYPERSVPADQQI